jgi:hypothetical protein
MLRSEDARPRRIRNARALCTAPTPPHELQRTTLDVLAFGNISGLRALHTSLSHSSTSIAHVHASSTITAVVEIVN